ncbi:MAG: hypothetical protein SFU83_10930 [Meiothermus sp.]|nr:hypothetical protein [Meiothermus sp.]
MRNLALASLCSFLLSLSSLALAHQPFWNAGSPTLAQAYRVLEPTVSKVVTGNLAAGQLAFYAFEVAAGFVLDLGIFVGAACPSGYAPRMWLVGKSLPKAQAPFALPEGMGAKVFEGGWQPYQGHGLVARKGPEFRERLAGGTYYVVVEAGGAAGYYMISLGGSEIPGGTAEGRAALGRFNRCG